jgi:predicted TPR repeat methyltransferase
VSATEPMDAPERPRIGPEFFDDLYASDRDPWNFETSGYETAKYDRTVAALGGRRFGRALEVGCSIGVLTERLAASADELLAIDVAAAAVEHARVRFAATPAVTVERRQIPEEFPDGPWELICRPATQTYPLRGDEVHTRLKERFGWPVGDSERTEDYVLDRFDRPAAG